jgi:hypothetical protein
MYRYNGNQYRTPGYGPPTGLGNPLTDLWHKVIGGITIKPPVITVPPIQIPGTVAPAPAPALTSTTTAMPSENNWVLPVTIAAVGLAALFVVPKLMRGGR